MGKGEQAVERRRELGADIELGQLELWVGVGKNISWPWIDVAVRIGKGWGTFLDINGPIVKRPDFLDFVPVLREFVEGRRNDALLGSLGGSMTILLRRSEFGGLYGEAWFKHGPNSQTVTFSLWEGALPAALAGAEAALQRVKSAEFLSWTPDPDVLSLLPRATDPSEPELPKPFELWDSGFRGEDVEFDYTVEGYGWYAITVRVGDKQGEFGGGYLTDPMGDLLRAALMLLADARRAELTCHNEPGLTRVEFERELVRMEVDEAGLPSRHDHGCRIRIREVDDGTLEAREPEFQALASSPRGVAEAIYRMALPHFREGAGPWSGAMAALQGALATVPPEPEQ